MAIIIQQREPALRCSLHELINSLGMHSFHSKNILQLETSKAFQKRVNNITSFLKTLLDYSD